jgi:predicted  nucleic acid-binding Zn-ribbon protein
MKSSVRGMAKVSVVWSIVFLVLAIVGGVAFFLASGEMETQKAQVSRLEKELQDEKAKVSAKSEEFVKFSSVVGYVDPTKGGNTDLATLNQALAGLKPNLGGVESAKTFADAIPLLVQAINNGTQRIAELQSQVDAKTAQIAELQKSLLEAGTAASTEATDLRRQLGDAQQQTEDTKSELERQIAELREQVRAKTSEIGTVQVAKSDAEKQFLQEAEALRTRMNEMGRKLQPFVKEPQGADGRILAVSRVLSAGWVDIGAANRLPVGTRFTVASSADNRVKAIAEVTRVENSMAEVRFVEQRDPFDPPAAGDFVWNPLYDPRGERYALLVGGFSGEYAESQLKGLLSSMGVTVQNKLDKATDFLILGNEQYVDQDGQPVETPIQPSELPVYKEAVAQGVQIVLLKDLRNYFRF